MKIISEGHSYMLQNFENPNQGQRIDFIQKAPVLPGSTTLSTVKDGTTNEEVIKVLINRLTVLNDKAPCEENKNAIRGLEIALFWLEERQRERKKKGILGTLQV